MQKYKLRYFELLSKKLGLYKKLDDDKGLINELLTALQNDKLDYTNFFYTLSTIKYNEISKLGSHIKLWLDSYKKRVLLEEISEEDRFELMRKTNPKYVLKNYMLQEAIDKAVKNDFSLVDTLLKIAQNPHAEHKEYEHYSNASNPHAIHKCGCSS